MSDRTIRIQNWYPFTLTIPNEPSIPLRCRRFGVDDGLTFYTRSEAIQHLPSARAIYRKADGDEQERRGDRYIVSDEEVKRRRLADLSAEAQAAYAEQEKADLQVEHAFLVETVRNHVRVAKGVRLVIETDDGEPVTVSGGDDLVKAFGGSVWRLREIVRSVWVANMLTPQEKKLSPSLSDLNPSSSTPVQAVPGPTPAVTAAPAASEDSVSIEAAMALDDPILSGST